jgi:hypothetical protein
VLNYIKFRLLLSQKKSFLKTVSVRAHACFVHLANIIVGAVHPHVDEFTCIVRNSSKFFTLSCHECAASGMTRTICSQGSICWKCSKKGHLGLHCKAQWRPTNTRLEATLGNGVVDLKNAGASTSKNFQSKERVDPLPSSAPDALPSPLRTDLNLAPLTAQASSPQRPWAAPSISQAQAQDPSALPESMTYQRANLTPFAPFGFHAMEVQH